MASALDNDNSGQAFGGAISKTSEEQALSILHRADVSAEALAQLARNPDALKSRKVTLAMAMHPRTPRHISLPLLRRMFTFDLMQVTLTPAVAADIKRAAEEQMLVRLESLSAGEKISLGRRASGRVAAELLLDADARVISAALENGRLVEGGVVTALMGADAQEVLFRLVSQHAKWPQRREIQMALLRSEKTPIEYVKSISAHFSPEVLSEILPEPRKPVLLGTVTDASEIKNSGS
jgi:hypothetical protein